MKSGLADKMEKVYQWLEEQILVYSNESGCMACGDCCRYKEFGHRIYITSAELVYFKEMAGEDKIKAFDKIDEGVCRFLVDGKCSVRDYRFGPCRIFFCKSGGGWQSELSERFLGQIRALCDETGLEYRYIDMAVAMEEIVAERVIGHG